MLIADDEALTRMGLRAMLGDMGHTLVGAAADGIAALRIACESHPDLALLDIKMPGMDGLAVAQAIAERCPLPVVMLSAYSERELVERAAATATVQAYLVKPVREADLGPVLELAASRFAEWSALQAEAAGRQQALEDRRLVAQAKGHLMERQGLSEAQAFLEIQGRARRARRTMRQVAEEILATAGDA
ncbi:MAG: response regulator [Chloroflexi bacterium]|nr:MAG: response regulator [Chloroflexota bacterium]